MRLCHILFVATAIFLTCCGTVTAAPGANGKNFLSLDPSQEISSARRYLKRDQIITEEHEARAITTPQFFQYTGVFKFPKFSRLPVIKQLNSLRLKFGAKIADKLWKKKYDANMF
ncbi:Avirulence (Avh) protein [Phytophthora megakarya]|uniref:RxLR effector protein n=1 Tax=Phytophthora megakarya TaxID=4795 RepID=A0A225UEK7_9STRA|nr:Avirulence (Avh) protein [Phytophthora megakarya]